MIQVKFLGRIKAGESILVDTSLGMIDDGDKSINRGVDLSEKGTGRAERELTNVSIIHNILERFS